MNRSNAFLHTLKASGYRITAQRRVICEFLAQTDLHPTPYQVYAQIASDHPEISRATVYNTLNVLKQLGAIVEMSTGDEHTHYETNTVPHVNLVCLRCRKIIDYASPIIDADLRNRVAEQTGFQPVSVKSELYGYCLSCQEKGRAEARADATDR